MSKLHQVSLSKERAQKAVLRAKELNHSFSRDTEKKLNEKLDVTEKNKEEQLKTLKNRLSAHVSRLFVVSPIECHISFGESHRQNNHKKH